MMSDIKLSVVIPTHNRRDLLEEMLTAFREQTLSASDFEVVVVIDGSADGTLEMVDTSEQPYKHKAVFQEQSGVAVARNRGAKEAGGSVVLFLDDDIMPHAQLLEDLDVFLKRPSIHVFDIQPYHLIKVDLVAAHYLPQTGDSR